ncbi:MAG: hypothetical protein ABF441_13695, partial [Lentilactobacillus hilgardii]|uniref:hypothetical protein n=1 Tax=Lentilactobacillus hilgardii TaxID=1588 RepID=UPI0039EC1A29
INTIEFKNFIANTKESAIKDITFTKFFRKIDYKEKTNLFEKAFCDANQKVIGFFASRDKLQKRIEQLDPDEKPDQIINIVSNGRVKVNHIFVAIK